MVEGTLGKANGTGVNFQQGRAAGPPHKEATKGAALQAQLTLSDLAWVKWEAMSGLPALLEGEEEWPFHYSLFISLPASPFWIYFSILQSS